MELEGGVEWKGDEELEGMCEMRELGLHACVHVYVKVFPTDTE